MEKIQVLGTGCPKCNQLEQNARMAVHQLGLPVEVVKVSDINEIMQFGVMITPAFAVDGDVKAVGKLLTVDEIKALLQES
ncbi:thioredoxin family protein [Candidatus Eisenbacteria bacterium]|uniref:Thioredoxin family protein n=1 Tax=Eiseniibacteriota bacterium TaxID=2212470 RepID=A0ABV6YJB5_UNCEI